MKKQSTCLLKQISTKQMEDLTGVVNETLAPGFSLPRKKVFTAAQLWNMQRQAKRIHRFYF